MNDENEKSCFNCVSGKPEDLEQGSLDEIANCTNKDVDGILFTHLDEYDLPDYCGKYKSRQDTNA